MTRLEHDAVIWCASRYSNNPTQAHRAAARAPADLSAGHHHLLRCGLARCAVSHGALGGQRQGGHAWPRPREVGPSTSHEGVVLLHGHEHGQGITMHGVSQHPVVQPVGRNTAGSSGKCVSSGP
jgi:hypothetical protein